MATGLKGIVKPDKTTLVRAQAEADAASLLSLYALFKTQAYRPFGAILGSDACGAIYGINKKYGTLQCHMVCVVLHPGYLYWLRISCVFRLARTGSSRL